MTAGPPGRHGTTGTVVYDHHLVGLIARVEAAAARLQEADPARREAVVQASRRAAARWSARLDASPLTDETADRVDAREAEGLPGTEHGRIVGGAGRPDGSGWAQALKLDGLPTEEVAALEYANLLATFDREPALAQTLFERPLDVLSELHGHITQGLVGPDAIGRPRRTDQAVHDGAQGRMIFVAPAPEELPRLMDGLAGWLTRHSVMVPAVVVAGSLHERLLEWQPFEAANGRVARAAARLVLRARRLDPDGAAVFESELAVDPLGYHEEVAATIRRRGQLGRWLERWTHAVCRAVEMAAERAGGSVAVHPPRRALAFLRGLPEDASVTLPEYAAGVGTTLHHARDDLLALDRAGLLHPQPGTRGLRWVSPRPSGKV